MTDDRERLRAGIAVLVLKDRKLLLGKRKGAHGAGDVASRPSPLFAAVPTAIEALTGPQQCWNVP